MRKVILVLMVLLLIPVVSAINVNEDYELYTINKCYGDVTVKIRSSDIEMGNDYYLVDCNRFNITSWKCVCNINGKTPIWFLSNTESIYDIVIEYYIEPQHDENSKRTLNFNNLEFGYKKPESSFKLPPIEQANMMFVIMFIVVAMLSFLIYFVIRKIVTSEENIIEESDIEKIQKEKEKIKKEIDGLETYR